jgi:CelD/BcsL family acetyltransferase involved in cellulose biosynthesis
MAITAQGAQAESGHYSTRKEPSAHNSVQYTAKVIRTVDQFAALSSRWNTLLDASGEFNISLRHEWLLLWLKTFPPVELLTVVVQDNAGELVAIAPLLISRNDSGVFCRLLRRLQFIGTAPEVYDCMKVVVHPEADAESVFRLLGEHLILNRSRWDIADLRYIEPHGQMLSLRRLLSPIVRQVEVSEPMSIPYIDLPEDWSAYPTTLRKRKYRSDLNRIHNHIRSDYQVDAAELVIHQPGEASDRRMGEFLEFHREYWLARGSRSEACRYPQLLGFYQTVYRQFSTQTSSGGPVFEFSTLELGGEPISYHFDIQSPKGCMGYLSCYEQQAKKYRPGILHIEALIARTHQLGGRRFEFGRGDEHYKNQWHIEKKPLWNLLAFRTPLSQVLWQLDEALKNLKTRLDLRLRNGMTTHGSNDPSAPPVAQPGD